MLTIIGTPGKRHLMAFRWQVDDGPIIVVLGSSLPSSTAKKKTLSKLDPSDKTFWIRACIRWYALGRAFQNLLNYMALIIGLLLEIYKTMIWALTRENLSSEGCEQHRRRPACASAQTDQRLCYSLFGKYHIQTCFKRNFNFLACLCSLGGLLESHFVRNPEDRFSRDKAHLIKLWCGVAMRTRLLCIKKKMLFLSG